MGTPFEAVYGRPPLVFHQFLHGEVRVQALADDFRSRDEVLHHLCFHLEQAQERLTRQANKHRCDLEIKVGDWVWLKCRPYHSSAKLAPDFFGLFEVEARVGSIPPRLESIMICMCYCLSLVGAQLDEALPLPADVL